MDSAMKAASDRVAPGVPSAPPAPIKSPLSDPANAPLGTTVVFPADQDEHHPRQIAIRWAPPYDMDEQYPWLIVGSEGPQRLSHYVVEGCEVLTQPLAEACATADLD